MSTVPKRVFTRRRLLNTGVTAAVVLPGLSGALKAQAREVVLYNWDSYIDPETIPAFQEETGIRVRYDLFASNDELFAKLRAGNPGYDVVFPSNDWVARMIAADMLMPLDHDRIPNLANIMPRFMDPRHDPGRAHSVPYFWGTVGLGYRKSVASPTSWGVIYTDGTHAGRIAVQREIDTLLAGLKYLGYSINTTDPDEIEDAVQLLLQAKAGFKTFAPDTGQDLLLSREVDLALEYNGDVLQVMQEDDDLSFVVPEEGTILWEDDMVVPRGAPHVEEAHAFIDFVHDAENNARIAEWVMYPTPNAAAKELLPQEIIGNPAIFPPDAVLDRSEFALYQGEEIQQMRNDAMTRVLAG
ncbi:MAG: extracellular solute-binding protein [Alphaproteobacteria bacterium]|jgi:spermidine/putrescine transport system substrate-binding protein|nr:extracellular solute-binding protein [Alphaproteobacteria bacterium]